MNTSTFSHRLICFCFLAIASAPSGPASGQEPSRNREPVAHDVWNEQPFVLHSQTEIVVPIATYDPSSGDLLVAYPNMFWLEVRSKSGLFRGKRPPGFDGIFDRYSSESIFKLHPGLDELQLPGALPLDLEDISSEISVFIAPEFWNGLESFRVPHVMTLPEPVPSSLLIWIISLLLLGRSRPIRFGMTTMKKTHQQRYHQHDIPQAVFH